MTTGTHRDARYPHRIPRLLPSHANMLSSNTVMPALRVAQFTLAFVTLGLSAYGMSFFHKKNRRGKGKKATYKNKNK